MLSLESENKRTGIAIALSIIVHALLLLLLPGFNAPIGYNRLGDGLPIDVTIIPLPAEEEVTTPVVTPKPPVEQPVVKPIETPVEEPLKPVEPPVAVAPEPKEEAPQVLTTINPVAPVNTATSEPEPAPEPEPEPEPVLEVIEPQPPPPPIRREVVSGLGILIMYPSKEAAFLRSSAHVHIVVSVIPQDMPQGRLIGTTGSDELDRWVLLWSERRFSYTPWSEPYEVEFLATIDPHTRSVTFDLLEPDSRVRIVQP
ncbi:MAG TPA: hypothetical protein GXZ82_11870 [Firmicutes bacterium]|nr:hypothetical protein [Bacillota bacterium]